jgi:hypothetical protein
MSVTPPPYPTSNWYQSVSGPLHPFQTRKGKPKPKPTPDQNKILTLEVMRSPYCILMLHVICAVTKAVAASKQTEKPTTNP